MYLNLLGCIDFLVDVLFGLNVDRLKGWLSGDTEVSRSGVWHESAEQLPAHLTMLPESIIKSCGCLVIKVTARRYRDADCDVRQGYRISRPRQRSKGLA